MTDAAHKPALSGRVVIVGAGHAAGQCAALLRQFGWTGPITLVGEEPHLPYQRPPLSKAWLKGEADAESLEVRPEAFYEENNVTVRTGARVSGIDREAKTVALEAGGRLPYDRLILATGARARPLPVPGAALKGVLALRNAADAEALKAQLKPGRRLVVIGGGYIGLEAAASARALGAHVTVVEREPRLLARVACNALSDFFQSYHEAHGVEFELGAAVEALEGEGEVRCAQLTNGQRLPCEAVLVGVGAVPNVELAEAAGLDCDDGVVVDIAGRTSDPCVSAIGDCTKRPLPLYGRMARLESVPSALEQARQVACDLTGRPPPNPEVPWFWSDQYDIKLQIAGMAFDAPLRVMRGDPAAKAFSVFHLTSDNCVQAVEAVNMPDAFMGGRMLIASRKAVAPARLGDMSVAMKAVLA
jgi:3-phenylpropionate/trans-cinnamate dioxygenase ferredoxin reductase subunit